MSSGKATELKTTQMLRQCYRTAVDIQRLPDKYDTGKYEDTRPSDFIVILSRDISNQKSAVFYIECKETEKPKSSFSFSSSFRKGQLQGMVRAAQLKQPYYVVFHILSTEKIFLVPAIEILSCINAGKKSISMEIIEQYPWTTGALHDYY